MTTLCDAALDVLSTADAGEKARKSRDYAARWRGGEVSEIGVVDLPERPARPDKPELRDVREMPKRRKAGSDASKIALLHAIAHIELNAIDLAWDVLGRSFLGCHPVGERQRTYTNGIQKSEQQSCSHMDPRSVNEAAPHRGDDGFVLPKAFYDDWVKVADDEAKHFLMLEERLGDFGASYGDLPAHDGLWEASIRTADDFAARLAIVPMVLEARGLDVTPNMIAMMEKKDDTKTAAMLRVIHDDEVTHVRAGTVWFQGWCAFHGKDVETHWQHLVRTYFDGRLKPPFNHPSREDAGMIRDWYESLAVEGL